MQNVAIQGRLKERTEMAVTISTEKELQLVKSKLLSFNTNKNMSSIISF